MKNPFAVMSNGTEVLSATVKGHSTGTSHLATANAIRFRFITDNVHSGIGFHARLTLI